MVSRRLNSTGVPVITSTCRLSDNVAARAEYGFVILCEDRMNQKRDPGNPASPAASRK